MLDVRESKELTATVLALAQMDRVLRRRIYAATRSNIVPEWRQELAADATNRLEERIILGGARADVSEKGVKLKAAQSKKKLSGGASPSSIGHAVEFGAPWRRGTIDATSNRGRRYTYQRTLNKQLKPRRQKGYLAYPAARRLAPRFASLWVQTTIKTMYDAIEGKLS